jgi:hypothetical protein
LFLLLFFVATLPIFYSPDCIKSCRRGKIDNSRPVISRVTWAILLIVVFVLVDFTLGVYHLTHGGGWVSGSVELFIAVLVGTLAFRFARRGTRGKNPSGAARYRRALLTVFALIVIALLILSPYHLTHQGIPSGSIELALAVTITAIGLLLR